MHGRGLGRGRGNASERRVLTVVMTVVLASVLIMLWMSPNDDVQAALLVRDTSSSAPPGTARVGVAGEEAAPMAEVIGPLPAASPAQRDEVVALPRLADPRLVAWVNDLRDDGIPGNAGRAIRSLIQLQAGSIPELVEALDSFDPQLQHFAAGVLRARCDEDKAEVSTQLLRVSIAALRSDLDDVERAAFGTWIHDLKKRSTLFLQRHAAAAQDLLAQQLTSFDSQQRFYCAYLLSQSGLEQHKDAQRLADRSAFELVRHLGDNQVAGDALMATNGLYRLGPCILPILQANHRFLDEQGRKMVDLILLDLKQPPRTRKEFYERGSSYRLSRIYHDVAIEYDIRRSSLPSIRN